MGAITANAVRIRDEAGNYPGINDVEAALAHVAGGSPTAIYKPNGVNDATKINAILASMGPGVLGLVSAWNSPYVLDETVILQEGQALVGQGKLATKLWLANGVNATAIKNAYDGTTAAEGCSLRSFFLDCNKANQTQGNGIWLQSNDAKASGEVEQDMNHLLFDLIIENAKQDGYTCSGRGETKLISVFAHSCDGRGFAPSYDHYLLGCVAGSSGLQGFYLQHSAIYLALCKSFYSGQITSTLGHGFDLAGTSAYTNCNLVGCVAQDNEDAGFYLNTGAGGSILSGCTADSNSTRGSANAPGFDVQAQNCVIEGISVERKADGTHQYQQNALSLHGGATGNIIRLAHLGVNGATVGAAIKSGGTLTGNSVEINGGERYFGSLPTSDPLVAGQGWNNVGVYTISAG